MLVLVFNQEDKERLLLNGYKFICNNKIGKEDMFIFEDNNKLNFEKENIKFKKTNKMFF